MREESYWNTFFFNFFIDAAFKEDVKSYFKNLLLTLYQKQATP